MLLPVGPSMFPQPWLKMLNLVTVGNQFGGGGEERRLCFLFHSLFFVSFYSIYIGLTLVNKITWASSAHFCNTPSAYCIVCQPATGCAFLLGRSVTCSMCWGESSGLWTGPLHATFGPASSLSWWPFLAAARRAPLLWGMSLQQQFGDSHCKDLLNI